MLYNKEEERAELNKHLDMLFSEFGTSMAKVCRETGTNYANMKYHMNRGFIDHDDLQTFIHSFAPDRFIQQRNGKLVIAKKL